MNEEQKLVCEIAGRIAAGFVSHPKIDNSVLCEQEYVDTFAEICTDVAKAIIKGATK